MSGDRADGDADSTTGTGTGTGTRTGTGTASAPDAEPGDAGGIVRSRDPEEAPSWPAVGVVLAVLWLFVRGVAFEPAALLGELLVGLAVGLSLAYASRRFYWPETDVPRLVRATPYMALFVAVFVKDVLVANVDVAYRVLAPSMPIEPAVIDLPLRVRSDVAITTIANSITLTPGTLTMDYDEDRNALYVHAIDGRDRAAVVAPIRRWEDYALVIFDEDLKPGDPVPQAPLTDGGSADVTGGDRGGD